MTNLLRPARAGAAIIMLTAAVAATLVPLAPARADFDADQKLCNSGGSDLDG